MKKKYQEHTTQPVVDRNLLASAMVFNYLVCNTDAHGKNFSLLHHQDHIQLAPFYDIICTDVYSNLSTKMAMKIGSQYNPKLVFPRHWEQLCNQVNFRYHSLVNLLENLGNKILCEANKEKEELHSKEIKHPIIEKIIHSITIRTEQTFKKFRSTSDP